MRTNPSPILRELGIEHQITSDGCVGWLDASVDAGTTFQADEATFLLRQAARKRYPAIPPPPKIEITNPRWEPILKDERGIVVGAADLSAVIFVKRPEISVSIWKLDYSKRELEAELCALLPENAKLALYDGEILRVDGAVVQRGLIIEGFPQGVIGCAISRYSVQFLSEPKISGYEYKQEFPIYVEAKTKIRTAGEILRQINLYRSVVRSGSRFIVVAPADAWEPDMKDILREQGVGALDYLSN